MFTSIVIRMFTNQTRYIPKTNAWWKFPTINHSMKISLYTFLVKGECKMMPRVLTRLLALFCECFGQTSYMIKISGKWRPIWLLGTVEKRFKTWQSFCTKSISTRLLSDKSDHRHPWLNHRFLELFLPNSCFATTYNCVRLIDFYGRNCGKDASREEKVGVTNVTITRRTSFACFCFQP